MASNFQAELAQEIAAYEQRDLDTLQPRALDPAVILGHSEFVRINGIANFWQADEQTDFMKHVIDLTIGAHSYSNNYLTFVLAGTPHQIDIYFSLDNLEASKSLLHGAYPGLSLQKTLVGSLEKSLETRFRSMGMISGIPSQVEKLDQQTATRKENPFYLERVIRGMRGATWVYVVRAYPRLHTDVVEERQDLLDKIAHIASLSRQQVQESTQTTKDVTLQTESVTKTISGEVINRQAEYAVGLLERELERLDASLAMGRWQTAVYFGATQASDARRLAALLTGILSGPNSRPNPIRAHFCTMPRTSTQNVKLDTNLSSDELALLIPLPREEVPGYAIYDQAQFDVDFIPPSGRCLKMGKIQWDGTDAGQDYQLKTDDLSKHGVVFGVTGSGKTTTVLHLLHQAWRGTTATPFLVIEPAKTEYRALLGRIKGGSADGPIPELRLYTLGNDTVAPFRLNPFEFELGNSPGSGGVLSHIDFLKAVFNAAFILYAPMPYVLETALHEIYEDKGWNLATGVNVRLPDEAWKRRHLYPIFPTLTDLYHKIEEVTARLGYETRIEQDVIAGLKARLGALRLGSKGLMLDTPRGIPIAELLSEPTVLELENIGNDDEKTFLIGLLFARIYGYRRLQAAEGKLPNGLQHILVIEEAHRLLKHVSTNVDTESSNLRSQAIETFVNMLSEIRHYGQGALVAEQIPSKLTPDVVKNTNLKLIHRLLAQDDRELLGATMNMNEAQTRRLTTLKPGEAIAYAEGDDHPFLLKIKNFKATHRLYQPLDKHLPDIAEKYISLEKYLPVPDFENYGVRKSNFGAPDTIVYQAALRYLSRPDNRRLWARIIARAIFARKSLPEVLTELRRQIESNPGHLLISQHNDALMMLIILGASQALQERGAEKGLPYPAVDSMRQSFTAGLIKLAKTKDLKIAARDLDNFVRDYEKHTKREWGPYPGCHTCRAVCLYRSEVKRLLSPIDGGHIKGILADPSFESKEEKYNQLGRTLRAIVKQWLGGGGSDVDEIGYCAALVSAPLLGLDEYEQADFGRALSKQILI